MSTLKTERGTGLLLVNAFVAAENAALVAPALAPVLSELGRHYGAVVAHMEPILFDFTDYYIAEMGSPLFKTLLAFERPFPREGLIAAKERCVAIEERLRVESGQSGRRINLDPGLLTLENFVLATGKNRAHRIYLGRGVFAELTLLYRHGGDFSALPWTYADYKDARVQAFLKSQRARLARPA